MQNTGISIIDLLIAFAYIMGTIGIGIYFSRKQKSAKDFLYAGRSMGWLPVGLSLMATLTSAVGYMAYPAGAFKGGLILLWMALSIPLSYPLIVYVFMPFYHKLKVVTAYEYLEKRFNDKVRALASIIFIIWRITWMAAVIYVPSLVLDVVSNGEIPLVPSIIVMGIIATVKTALGGAKAVMWGDVIHSFVMFLGLFVSLGFIINAVPGGLSEIWDTLVAGGKTKMTGQIVGFNEADFTEKIRLYLVTDFTVVSLIITYTVQKMGNYCVDQAMVQRYISAKSLKESQKGFYANAVSYLLYIFLVTAIGVGLFAVANHLQFPSGMSADNYFPYFIANVLPVGITGLMVAAIWAASLSSLDGGINSITTAILNDFYARYKLKQYNLEVGENSEEEKARRLKLSRILTIVIGIAITFFAFFVGLLGDIFNYSQSLINMFTGPLFGVFILGMFTKRATAEGALIGGFVGFAIGSLMVFAKNLNISYLGVGVLWPAFLSFVITIVLGYVLSLIIGKNTPDTLNYTRRNVMRNDSL
jgi:sodium-coupled monocarboxylate transporter 8/12